MGRESGPRPSNLRRSSGSGGVRPAGVPESVGADTQRLVWPAVDQALLAFGRPDHSGAAVLILRLPHEVLPRESGPPDAGHLGIEMRLGRSNAARASRD